MTENALHLLISMYNTKQQNQINYKNKTNVDKKLTQDEIILAHLRIYKTINIVEATELYDCYKLNAIIWRLRALGFKIIRKKIDEHKRNRYTLRKQVFTEYELIGEPNEIKTLSKRGRNKTFETEMQRLLKRTKNGKNTDSISNYETAA